MRGPDGVELWTDVIGRFKVPLNCVAASPDGKLLAVVGDSAGVRTLFLVAEKHRPTQTFELSDSCYALLRSRSKRE